MPMKNTVVILGWRRTSHSTDTHPSSSTEEGVEKTVGRKEAMQSCHDLLPSPGDTGNLKWRPAVTTEVESLYWHLCL